MEAYQEFVSARCVEIIEGNSEVKALHEGITKTIQEIKKAFTPDDFALFCDYESQINNVRAKENRCIYEQARKDNL